MADIAQRAQGLVQTFVNRSAAEGAGGVGMADLANIGAAFFELTAKMMAEPTRLMDAQVDLWRGYMELWRNATLTALGQQPATAVAAPEAGDKRFNDPAWQENQVFDFIKQSYLLTTRWMQSTVADVQGLDPHTKHKVEFFTRQFADALAPTNFALTNPQVLRATAETKGENLIKGLQNLLEDLEKGKGRLRVSMTDEEAFTVGVNVAATPGKVVAETPLMQLIQYTPTTDSVKEIPVVIVPPWINKFYILDLREKNSLVKWLTDQGYTTFIVSWVNPDAALAETTFDDYMIKGAIAAKDAVLAATGAERTHMVGYCIGGTLLASTLAYLKARKDKTVASATYFVTLTDFSEPGDLGVFIDDEQVSSIERRMEETGYLDAADMAMSFNMLRANDLIWSFVVSNYLLGKEPFPFDLLYWNADSTRMPRAMHGFYLRKMYLENRLCVPGGVSLAGVPIDLSTIDVPTYMISCREDHIAPWKSTFAATQLFKGPTRFVLSGSGHIAGVVNPPAARKYGYWTNDKSPGVKKPQTPDEWLAGATEHPGSWWTDWDSWLRPQSGGDVPARVPGSGKLKAIEDAPGRYVKTRAV
ncbi:MAG: class I poly(R)-hydroxyalkanoic acid synthase [Rhodospirillaceae bacterium]